MILALSNEGEGGKDKFDPLSLSYWVKYLQIKFNEWMIQTTKYKAINPRQVINYN